MKRLILYALTCIHLSSFGAASSDEGISLLDPFGQLIKITPAPASTLQHQIAFKQVGSHRLMAFLVAGEQLSTNWNMHVAGEVLAGIQDDPLCGHDSWHCTESHIEKLLLRSATPAGLQVEGLIKKTLAILFVMQNEHYPRLKACILHNAERQINCCFKGTRFARCGLDTLKKTNIFFVEECEGAQLLELRRRGMDSTASWTQKLNGYYLGIEFDHAALHSYFCRQVPDGCAGCEVL